MSGRNTTPEGFASNCNYEAASRCVSESDIIVLFGLQGATALLAASLASVQRKPLISVNQSLPIEWELRRRWWVRLLKSWLLRRCCVHVCQTAATYPVLTEVYGIQAARIEWAPFEAGADLFRNAPKPDANRCADLRRSLGAAGSTLFLFSGNLHPFKGVFDLIDASAVAFRHIPGHCVFAGPEEPRNGPSASISAYMDRARALGIGDRVHFLGRLSHVDLAAWYVACDVVVLPTKKDCFPKVLVEAAVLRRPLITTTACGATGSIVKNGLTGFVVPPGSPEALADAMVRLAEPQLRAVLGENAFRAATEFCDPVAEAQGFARAIHFAAELSR